MEQTFSSLLSVFFSPHSWLSINGILQLALFCNQLWLNLAIASFTLFQGVVSSFLCYCGPEFDHLYCFKLSKVHVRVWDLVDQYSTFLFSYIWNILISAAEINQLPVYVLLIFVWLILFYLTRFVKLVLRNPHGLMVFCKIQTLKGMYVSKFI